MLSTYIRIPYFIYLPVDPDRSGEVPTLQNHMGEGTGRRAGRVHETRPQAIRIRVRDQLLRGFGESYYRRGRTLRRGTNSYIHR